MEGKGSRIESDVTESWSSRGFRWRDGERLLRFGPRSRFEALGLLADERLSPFVLLTTPRAAASLPEIVAAAELVVHVPPGAVPESGLAAEALAFSSREPRASSLVALGGGRVVDVCKAVAAAQGMPCAALPTTLSGAELTTFHRPLGDGRGAAPNRPRLVITDPALAASQPAPELTASAMNAFGHAMEAVYGPGAGPVTVAAALDGVRRLVRGLKAVQREAGSLGAVQRDAVLFGDPNRDGAPHLTDSAAGRDELALGALLAGYAIGASGLGFHHALCQSVVRETGAPHAMVNAVLVPRVFRFMLRAAPADLAPLVAVLSEDGEDPVVRLECLAAASGVRRLGDLGIIEEQLPRIARLAARRSELARTPMRPGEAEALAVLRAAL